LEDREGTAEWSATGLENQGLVTSQGRSIRLPSAGEEKVSRFNRKKGKGSQSNNLAFARITPGGKWHIVREGTVFGNKIPVVFLGCRRDESGYPWLRMTRLHGFHNSITGFIFTKRHKICGTCMRMKRNRHIIKSAGFDM
jgi:hypothetical protein